VVPSQSHEESRSHSVSVVPFLEPHTRRVISSIEYLSQEEQALLAIQDMQGKRPQRCTAVINDHIVTTQAPYHPETEIATVTLETELARVHDRPAAPETPHQRVLLTPDTVITVEAVPLAKDMKDVTPAPSRIPEVLPPEAADAQDDAYELTNEDFLEP
jgi:hypothetical protein